MAAHDLEQGLEGGDDAEQRIARARATIGKSFEELISRTERQAAELGSPAPAPPAMPLTEPIPAPPPDLDEHPDSLVLAAVEERIERRLAAESAAIEERVGEWVNARVQAAERRLELQSGALEASLGQGADRARAAVEEIERGQADLAASAAQAIADVSTAAEAARMDLGTAVGERATESLGDVEGRIETAEAAAIARMEEALAGVGLQSASEELRAEVHAQQAAALSELEADLAAKLATARAELEAAFAQAVETRQSDSIERVEAILIRQSEQGSERVGEASRRIEERVGEGERRAEQATAALEERAAAINAGLEERAALLSAELGAVAGSASQAVVRVGDEIATRAADQAAAEAARVTDERLASGMRRLDQDSAELRSRLEAEIGAATKAAEGRLEAMRGELDRLARAGVDQVLAESVAGHRERAEAELRGLVDELAERLRERGNAVLTSDATEWRGRSHAELADAVAKARAEIEVMAGEITSSIASAAETRATEVVRAEFEGRAVELERRLGDQVERSGREAEQRLLVLVGEAEARLAAVDHAQEREERIRTRSNAAELEAERRVRDAEQRLIAVLARLDPQSPQNADST